METKTRIARRMYGASLSDLTAGQKAAVTRAYDAQEGSYEPEASSDIVTVKFGRPGVNGTKEVMVKAGTNMEDALRQSGLKINKTKDGVINKKTGDVVLYTHSVVDGTTYAICPGVDSSI